MTLKEYKNLEVGDVVYNSTSGGYVMITEMRGNICCVQSVIHSDDADMYELVKVEVSQHVAEKVELQEGHDSTSGTRKDSGAVQRGR